MIHCSSVSCERSSQIGILFVLMDVHLAPPTSAIVKVKVIVWETRMVQ
jgi:hypothetical protein